jgi:hypothetical protein
MPVNAGQFCKLPLGQSFLATTGKDGTPPLFHLISCDSVFLIGQYSDEAHTSFGMLRTNGIQQYNLLIFRSW